VSFWRFGRGLFERRKAELEEEIQAHLRMDVAARMERGESRAEAEASARREFGNVGLVRDVTYGFWRWGWLEGLIGDLVYSVRVLRRSAGFSIAVILTLAVGIGAACAMFTVVDRVLLRSLPYARAEQLISIRETGSRGLVYSSPYLDIREWRERSHKLGELAFYGMEGRRISFLDADGGTIHVAPTAVSANLFAMLDVHPALGRSFVPVERDGSVDARDAHSMILSDAAWRTDFGAQAAVLGNVVHLNGEAFTVIGVMPRGFVFPLEDTDLPAVWTPVVVGAADAIRVHNQNPRFMTIARLRDGATQEQAEGELKAIQPQVASLYPDARDREDVSGIALRRYSDLVAGTKVHKALLALLGASGLLWLIACVNVTSLMLARAAGRQREMAVRGALGASRWQIARQSLMERLLLSGCGSLLGLGLSVAILRVFAHGLGTQFGIHESLTPDLSVLLGLLGLTVGSALLISAWPAVATARARIEPMLRQGGSQSGVDRVRHRMRAALVVSEIALSLTLLVGCGLLLRTIYALRHVSLGFRTEHVLVANMTVPAYKFAGKNMTTELYQPLVDKVNRLPGVEAASLLTQVPLGKTFGMIFTFDRPSNSADDIRRGNLIAQFRAVGPEMQSVFGFRMVRGRFFNERDTASSQAVAVVNRAFVRGYFGDERDPGKILGENLLGLDKKRRAIVIGVVDDERQVSVADPAQPEIEVCIPQITPDTGFYKGAEGVAMDLAVRTELSPGVVLPELREILRKASPDLAESTFTTMDQIVEDSYGSQKLAAELLEIFAGSALLLCVAGIYGLLAYLVAQRTREMGVRIALGAQRRDVMGLVLRQAGWMLIAGLGLGLGLAYGASRGLRTFLFEVKPDDPWTLGAVTLLLFASGLVAAYWPARRAAGVDPMEALRTE